MPYFCNDLQIKITKTNKQHNTMKTLNNELKAAVLRKIQALQLKTLEIPGATFDVDLRDDELKIYVAHKNEESKMFILHFASCYVDPLDVALESMLALSGIVQEWKKEEEKKDAEPAPVQAEEQKVEA